MKRSKPAASNQRIWQKKGIWAAVILFLAACGGAAWYFLYGPQAVLAQSASKAAAAVNTTLVKKGDLSVTVSGSGVLEANRTVDLSFSTGGTVSEVHVQLGDMVKEGQVLARLDNASSLEANVVSLQLKLLQAQKDLTDLQQNADVSLAEAYQDWVTAKAAYQEAVAAQQRTAYARCSEEVNTRYKTQLDQASSRMNELAVHSLGTDAWVDAKNTYDTALANYTYCTTYTDSEKVEAQAAVDVSKTKMDQAERKYNTLKSAAGIDPSQLALNEAAVETYRLQLIQAKEDLQGMTLTAPMDGKVVYLASGVGTIVDTSKFISIADVSRPQLIVSVDESDIDHFVLSSPASVIFDALPDQTFHGVITQVDPSLTSSGQYRILKGVLTLNTDAVRTVQDLPLGLNASVTIVYKEIKDALIIPVTALKKLNGEGYEVQLVDNDGTTRSQEVQIGLQDGTYAEVLSGLNEGDKIIAITGNSSSSPSSNPFTDGGMMMPGGGMPPPP